MTQNTQTTAERIAAIIESGYTTDGFGNFDGFPVAVEIAAEIDALTRERDEGAEQYRASVAERVALRDQLAEARAEVKRLRPAAEAWEAWVEYDAWTNTDDDDAGDALWDKYQTALDKYDASARAAKESQP